MPSPSIHISNLTCKRGTREICAPVSFTVDAGHTLILRGANGSGKSTLLRMLAGLLPSNAEMPRTLYLGHANALHPSLNAIDHLNFWRALIANHDVASDVAHVANELILETLGLTAHRHVLAAHLSNGQKRRLSFARLLLQQADCWLLDEPQAALDASGLQMLLKLIEQHTSNGGTAIIASHDDLPITNSQTLELQAIA